MEKDTFTREEVFHLLLSIIVFDNANNSQGLSAMSKTYTTFGDKVLHLLEVADTIDTNSAEPISSTVSKIRMY